MSGFFQFVAKFDYLFSKLGITFVSKNNEIFQKFAQKFLRSKLDLFCFVFLKFLVVVFNGKKQGGLRLLTDVTSGG